MLVFQLLACVVGVLAHPFMDPMVSLPSSSCRSNDACTRALLQKHVTGSQVEVFESPDAPTNAEATAPCTLLRRTYLESERCGHRGKAPASGFLVTGTGRSGTLFLVQVLRELGLEVSHDSNQYYQARGKDGAVSWVFGNHKRTCALPWWSYNITGSFFETVYLMLREPLAQISSRADNGGLAEQLSWYDFVSCSSRIDVDALQKGENDKSSGSQSSSDSVLQSLHEALQFYVLQNSFIEQYAKRSFRVEALRDDPQVLLDICSRHGGLNCTLARVDEAMKDFGTSVHSEHTESTPHTTWSRLASIDRPFTAMAQALAQRQGYVIAPQDLVPEAAVGYWCDFDGPDDTSSRWTCMLKGRGNTGDTFGA